MSVIEPLIEEHERLRSKGINLIASENYLSPGVRKALASDLGGRYHTDWYGGSRIARDIIENSSPRRFRATRSGLVLSTVLMDSLSSGVYGMFYSWR